MTPDPAVIALITFALGIAVGRCSARALSSQERLAAMRDRRSAEKFRDETDATFQEMRRIQNRMHDLAAEERARRDAFLAKCNRVLS